MKREIGSEGAAIYKYEEITKEQYSLLVYG